MPQGTQHPRLRRDPVHHSRCVWFAYGLAASGLAAYGLAATFTVLVLVAFPGVASGDIAGGLGNEPIQNPGWPKGAAVIFNHKGRVSWWEGPPFGGGEYHSECRGDARAFNVVLKNFAKLEVETKQLVIHDGFGGSFWLNPNGEADKQEKARVDWTFKVWDEASWKRLRKLPADLNPTLGDPDSGPSALIDVYVGGSIHWADVDKIPDGIQVDDRRLEAHGFTRKDGIVLQGSITDLATDKPLVGRAQLQRVEPQEKGGYLYPMVSEAMSDEKGNWVIKNAPAGRYRVVVQSDGFVPRVLGYDRFNKEPRWCSFNGKLAPAAAVSGTITDDKSEPLEGVVVRLSNVVSIAGSRYQAAEPYEATTDEQGNFRLSAVPVGEAKIRLIKAGYFRPGLGQQVSMPSGGHKLSMTKSAELKVTVKFKGDNRPDKYMVDIEPEGGSAIGKYSGSGKVDDDNQRVFKNVPPGRYIIQGHPNPSRANQRTNPVIVELIGGKVVELTLIAK